MSADPALYRILDALKPFDGPRGSIELSFADREWLFHHLRSVEIESDVREGRPPDNRHVLWIALDVAMRPNKSRKNAIGTVADTWGAKPRHVDDCERLGRETAAALLGKFDRATLAGMVEHHRKLYRERNAS